MDSLYIRLHLWQQAIEAWLSAPLFGIGWGEYAYYLYENPTGFGMDRNAHNIILHFLAETGLVGTILLMFGVYFAINFRNLSNNWPFFGIIGVQLIHSMTEFPYAYMQFLVVTGLVIGLTHAKS